jgi:hypothetical protein
MAADRENPPRRAIDPFVEGVRDGVAHGYHAFDRVSWGVRESMRMQGVSRGAVATRTPRPRVSLRADVSQGGQPPTLGLIDDLLAIVGEIMHRAGGTVQEVAHSMLAQTSQAPTDGAGTVERIQLAGAPGEEASVDFDLWNTGTLALRKVAFYATELISSGEKTPRLSVTFEPSVVEFVRPGDVKTIKVTASVPPDAPPATYRGLIEAEPGDTCVVVELTVSRPGS